MKRKTILCSLFALACLGASTASAQASPVKIAIIKADDIRGITTNWDRFFALSKSKGIKVSAGIICNSLVGLDEDDAAFDEYAKIIDFLIAEGWIFVLPREYTSDTPLLANPSVSASHPTRSADLSVSRGVATQADLRFVCDTVDQGTDLESWTHSALVTTGTQETSDFGIVEIERPRILNKADAYLSEAPRTVTADICERSEGGPHDYYSEGDYWWPDPKAPEGPYVRRDGETNPHNFIAHRKSMIRLEFIVPYIVDKGSWPKEPDIMYWDEWPVQHPCLSFAGVKFQRADYLTTWRTLDADPKTFEVLRNLPLRHALLWTPIHGAEQ